LWLCLWAVAGCKVHGCTDKARQPGAQPAAEPAAATVALRFRPLDRLGYREHWVYDLQVPGTGIVRNALSLDVTLLAKLPQDSFAVRQTIHHHQLYEDKRPVPLPSVIGTTLTYQWAKDHSLVNEIMADGKDPLTAAAAKSAAQGARFGTLIEYPEQAVAVGDSWSIEPRRLLITPGHEATLRPSYTLEGLEQNPNTLGSEALISSDVQVDLVPTTLAEGVSIEGGGTAAGNLRVRVRDGVVLEARSVMHFSQETHLPGSETLGYREFSATAHVFTTAGDAEPNLEAEPYTIDPLGEDRECDLALSSVAQRLSTAPVRQHIYLQSADQGTALPEVSAGRTLREPGASVVISADGKHVTIDALTPEPKELAASLRAATQQEHPIIYVYAHAQTPLTTLRSVLAQLRPRGELRLMVRDPRARPATLKPTRWQEQQLRTALVAPTQAERELRLAVVLHAHLTLCEPALLALQQALVPGASGWDSLRAEVVRAFVRCGCNATQLDGLESTLYAIFGSPDLRWLPLDGRWRNPAPSLQNVGDLAKQLGAAEAAASAKSPAAQPAR
jgi:hypothetical protein